MQSSWKNRTSETEGTAAFREEARKITEKITKTIKMSLYFEESGETLSFLRRNFGTERRFGREDVKDMLAPVIKLTPLSNEEMLVLIEKLADIHAGLFEYEQRLTQEDLITFIKIEFGRIGADTNITPREVIRDFIELLNLIYQNPELTVETLLGSEKFSYAKPEPENVEVKAEEEFAEFEL